MWREERQGLYCLSWSVEEKNKFGQIRGRWWLASIGQLSPPSCWSPSLWKRPNDKQISQWGCKCWPYLVGELIRFKNRASTVLSRVLVLVLESSAFFYLIVYFVGSPNPVWAKPDIWQMLDPSFQPALQFDICIYVLCIDVYYIYKPQYKHEDK